MAKLSERAEQWLKDSNCFEEVSEDMLSLANSGIQILLSNKAIADLNRQAREAQET